MEMLIKILLGISPLLIAMFVVWLAGLPFKRKKQKIEKERKKWYLKYPVGTLVEVIQKSKWRESKKYCKVVSEEEYLEKSSIMTYGEWCSKRYLLNDYEILLCFKEEDGGDDDDYFALTVNVLEKEIKTGQKEIRKISDVKLKILELEGRK